MSRAARTLIAVLALSLVWAPELSRADSGQLVVWNIHPGKLSKKHGKRLAPTVRDAAKAVGRWQVIEVPEKAKNALERIARQCKTADASCAARAADAMGVRYVVTGVVLGRAKRLQLQLLLVDLERRDDVARARGPLTGKQLLQNVGAVVKKLSAAAQPTSGSIILTTNVTGADVRLDGTIIGKTPLVEPVQQIPVGPHELSVAHPEYETYAAVVDIRPGAEVRLFAELEFSAQEVDKPNVEAEAVQSKDVPAEVIIATDASASESDRKSISEVEQSQVPGPADGDLAVFPLTVGIEAGAAFSQVLSKLGTGYTVSLEVAYLLPSLEQRLGAYGNLSYTQPIYRTTIDDPRLNGRGSGIYKITEQQLTFNVGAIFRLFPPGTALNFYGQAGLRVNLQHSRAQGKEGGARFGENGEEATAVGAHLALGTEYVLWSGAIALELDFSATSLAHSVTGKSAAGGVGILLGYHFLF